MMQNLDEKVYLEVNKKNKRNMLLILCAVLMLDCFFYVVALFAKSYVAKEGLLAWMVVNIVVEFIFIIIIQKLFDRYTRLVILAVPLMILVLKFNYLSVMNYDLILAEYLIAIVIVLCLSIRSQWEMLVVALTFELLYIVNWSLGHMDAIEMSYAIVIINGVVTVFISLISIYRYNDYYDIIIKRETLMQQKSKIELYSKMKDISLELNHKMLENICFEEFLKHVIERLVDIIPAADAAAVLEIDGDNLTLIASVNYIVPEDGFTIPTKATFASKSGVVHGSEPVIINNLDQIETSKFKKILTCESGDSIKSSLTSQLIINGKFRGLFNLDSKHNHVFTDDDKEILSQFRDQMSIALENHNLYAEVIKLSQYDQLTGFRNRWYINEIHDKEIHLWQRHQTQVTIALFDLDKLKVVNDTYGHDIGDQYIEQFCNQIKDEFRKTDIFIRNGGDEFLGIFFNMTPHKLKGMLEAFRHKSSMTIEINNYKLKSVPILFSYGMVDVSENDYHWNDSLKLADELMYEYKEKNREI